MRRTDQRVERRIRLWVVQQERLRLTSVQAARPRPEERHEAPPAADTPAREG